MNDNLRVATLKLLSHCRDEDWAGYEPYDALNSKLLEDVPFLNFKLPRLVLTQILKRSPINVRQLLRIPKTQNPKAIGLFVSTLLKLSKIGMVDAEADIALLIERLVALRSEGSPYWCWGYNFPWQTRGVLVPRWAPNLVCTFFVASALLDYYEQQPDSRILNMAVSSADYILHDLYWSDDKSTGFAYPLPSVHGHTHNANFLAAALLCRVYKLTGEKRFLTPALSVARYAAGYQHPDGSWYYGEAPSQRWIDNFHTGYNLLALRSIGKDASTGEFEAAVRRGFEFYRSHFFREDGAVGYFHNRMYPLDTHCVAQSIITLLVLQDLSPDNVDLAFSVFRWSTDHMWDARGFFYYRILRLCTIRTSYIRWTQAWMLLAMSMLLGELQNGQQPNAVQSAVPIEVA
jgi:hypothetical protein